MKKHLWVIGGTVCVGLGSLGIFLPILPTIPYLLLEAICSGRGSRRFYDWLVNRAQLSLYIHSYREGCSNPLKQKLIPITLLWLTIGLTICLAAATWLLKGLLVVVAVGVTVHLIKIKTLLQEPGYRASQANSLESVGAT